jgi:Fur family ferric uptake transcriptional regulator
MQKEMEIFEQCLRARNLKHSKPRRDILEVFLASEGHLTAHDLYERVKRKNPRIGFATVYRTLKLLEECNLARSVDYGDGTQRYEPDHFQHHHIICTACNRTIEFLSPELEALLQQVQQEHQFLPQMYAIRILSVCQDCTTMTPRPSRRGRDLDTILSRDALQVAIANEQRGLHFYSQAVDVTEDVATREVFLRLVEEEERHLIALEREYNVLREAHPWVDDEPSLLHFDPTRLEGIFPSAQFHVSQVIQPVNPAEALYLAMVAERRSYEFFSDYADKVELPTGRAIFQEFAHEEERHLTMLRHAYDALQDRTQDKPAEEPA